MKRPFLPDVVFTSCQVTGPVAGLPETVSVHFSSALTERRVTVRCPLQIKVPQLLQVGANYLKDKAQQPSSILD